MTRQKFIELTGENPEDVLGEDWRNLIDEYGEDLEYEKSLKEINN